MLIVSYHTNDGYADEAQRLAKSVRRVGMNMYAQAIGHLGNWYDATRYKAIFLQTMRRTYPGVLLYVDADAVFHRRIEYHEFDHDKYDLGVHYHHKGRKLGSGTLFLADTPACRGMLDQWVELNRVKLQRGEYRGGGQANLSETVDAMRDLRVWRLPARYCYITDLSKQWDPHEPVVIEHLQASREFRNPGRSSRLLRSRKRRLKELENPQ